MVTLTYQERFKTLKGVFDEFTIRTLFELQSRNYFDELISPFSVGKESNVFIAKKGEEKVIVKIYFVQNCNFNKMYDYIKKDDRYSFLKKSRKHKREIIFAWAQREFKNLLRAERGTVAVPKPFAWRNHILIQEFIGDEDPAPPLKDKYPKQPKIFLEKIIAEMKKLNSIGLVHGDLSSFNILNHHENPVLIDFSQATLLNNSEAEELLKRDLRNILKFFQKLKVKEDFAKIYKKIKE